VKGMSCIAHFHEKTTILVSGVRIDTSGKSARLPLSSRPVDVRPGRFRRARPSFTTPRRAELPSRNGSCTSSLPPVRGGRKFGCLVLRAGLIGRGIAHCTMTTVRLPAKSVCSATDGPSRPRSPVNIFAYSAAHEPLRSTQPPGLHDVLL
jgi:hypothetical protein